MTQGVTFAIIGGEEQQKHMRGEMIEADFEQDTITLKMFGAYHAVRGTFVLVPYDDYEAMAATSTGNKESK